jgi:hypothetical protein
LLALVAEAGAALRERRPTGAAPLCTFVRGLKVHSASFSASASARALGEGRKARQ